MSNEMLRTDWTGAGVSQSMETELYSPKNARAIGGVEILAGANQPRRLHDYVSAPTALRGSALSSDWEPSSTDVQRTRAYPVWGKRLLDVLVGSVALLASLPVLMTAAVLVYLDDGGPALFIQRRVGLRGRPFNMYKFRTMVRDADALRVLVEHRDSDGRPLYKAHDDVRVTRIGRFLRRFSIDELPQLLNVLKGEMSLVGPRPELPHIVLNYEPWQVQRLSVLPGITGWWQIRGRSERPMHLHTADDLYYVRNRSIWLDLWILCLTPWAVLGGRGAY